MRSLLSMVLLVMFSACGGGCGPVSSPRWVDGRADREDAKRATVRVYADVTALYQGQIITGVPFGTGWFMEQRGDRVVVATAGHVCVDVGEMIGDARDVQVLQVRFRVVTASGQSLPMEKIYDRDGAADDVCLLGGAVRGPQTLMRLADTDTAGIPFGEPVWYVGFPAGKIGLFDGAITGFERDEDTGELGQVNVSIPGKQGASGSAIMNSRGEVVGMLVALLRAFDHAVFSVPIEYLREAQRTAREWVRRDDTDADAD